MSNKPVSGIPSSDHDAFAHRAELHQKLCRAIIPFYTENAEFLEIQDSILLALSGLLTTTKELVLACNSNDEYKLSPEAMAGFIDSILCQVDALKVINEELWSEIVSLKKQGGLNK